MYTINGACMTISDVVRIARGRERVCLSNESVKKIQDSWKIVEKIILSDKPVYGINTGFGELSKVFISRDEREKLQRNLILSHCTGVGAYLPEDTVRAAIVLRVNSLSKGYSGIRVSTVEKLIEMLNKDICPAVPCKGSVGASGDLAPLSHLVAPMLGEGLVIVDG